MADYTYGIGQELQFNTPGLDLTHTWDFGDGTPISSAPTPTHTYTLLGIYTITHGAKDFCGSCTTVSHTVDIVQASITVRSVLLDTYTAKVGDIVKVTVIAQNLSPIFGTGTIVVRFDSNVVGTFNATLDSNQEVSFDVSSQVTIAGTINVSADDKSTVLFVESNVSVKSITLDENISTGNPIIATIEVQNVGIFTENKKIQTSLTNIGTVVIDERIVTVSGTMTYQVPVSVTGLPNGIYTLCAENICKAISIAIPTDVTGILSISSTPTGAEILIDGPSTGQNTNTTVAMLTPGNHTFTLRLDGYNNTTGQFTIIAGMTTYVYSTLSPSSPMTGGISISTNPTGAEIYINDVQQLNLDDSPLITTATIVDLSPTSYNITLKLSGYIDSNNTIDIMAGQTTYMSISLMRSPILIGSINFTTTPDGATIFIDGTEKIGKFTPITIADIPIGSHAFVLKYTGRNDATGIVNVVGGFISYVYVDMSIVSPTEGSFSISSIPQGSDIYIDGVLYPTKTPTTIDHLVPKLYTILLKKIGYNDYITMINAIAGETISINTTLVPKITVTGLEFPWWLALGIGIGMFQAGKFKETQYIKDTIQLLNSGGSRIVTLTKKDYKIK